ncbi:MAG: two-component system sensor histidine kinase NtrB, partial [bacterium]
FDTTMISLGIYIAGVIEADFYIVLFLEIIFLSMAHNLKNVIFSATIFCCIYGFFIMNYFQKNLLYRENYLLRLPLLFIFAIYFGSVAIIFKKKIKEVKNLSERCRLIFSNIRDMVFCLDCHGKFTFVSPSSREVIGQHAKTLIENPDIFYFQVLPDDKNRLISLLSNLTKQPKQGKFEFRINHPIKGTRWLQMTYSPNKDEDGSWQGIQGSIRDISDLKETQNTIIQSERLMSMGKLASSMALEINNPLQAIKNMLNLLDDKMNFDDTQKNALEIIKEGEAHIENILQKILEISYHDTSEKVPVDIHLLLQKAVSITKSRMKLDKIQIKFAFDPENVMVMANQKLLYDVFLNIILNSIEALNDGGKISLSTIKKKEHLTVQFTDNGQGIPAEQLAHIFEPFYTTKKKTNSSGLGLTICYWILREIGGDIRINSLNGIGTTTTLTLPICDSTKYSEKKTMEIKPGVCHV